ncbi:FtsX-like permease family protein [bacterium]|nr:FtsX-like permease family protein [bacterium]
MLPPKGKLDDYRIYINLADAQALLDQPQKINAILSFACLHVGNLEETNAFQHRELNKIQPGFKQITKTDIFQGRYLARQSTRGSLKYLLTIILGVVVLLIVVTGLQEVAERRREVGIFVSMGANYFYICCLYFCKILCLALAASIAGFLIGSQLAVAFNAPLLASNTQPVRFLWEQLPSVIYMTCSIALLAEVLPIARLLMLDPAATLIEE